MTVSRNLLTDIEGVSVGHCTDLKLGSGVTVIVFDAPAVASGTVMGGAPGGRDTALLDPSMSVGAVDALVLSGGSAFGLDAAGGVQAGLREIGRGLQVGTTRVPIVPQAILMDLLNGGDKDWGLHSPYRDMGYQAFLAAAKGEFPLGSVGAGTGATTATVKGGLGSASAVTSSGHRIAALVAVNALGTPTIGDGPHFWAAPFEENNEFGGLGMPPAISTADRTTRLKGVNITATTIGVVITDAIVTKAEAHRLSIMAQDGLARALLPAHLPFDGDTVFAASTGARPMDGMIDFLELCQLSTTVMARAIARGVHQATALPFDGAQPAWRDLFGSSSP
ncbi:MULTISPECIES: P1 family peptidase [unclassified Rhizobium]|uniref:P1 family peptidase n=1 Tax=unclassified Rhizobium TaxID=2613769 RepID=UPI001ADB2D51|nr:MULTISPECIES: P1 family peptidase [unclassified Rhizobium]MBO9096830.1 P1 family peptidase [Rhizobium sp. L58/93]MBO9167085.1 P1 family peptidase [Rhizobium sp. L245/93]MBO9183057.1 P1 family peptidase [Rhizobium sp. E27B/91]MBO9134297.1 P1 family peptidase [Rhizobium sp. B209b/85]QXZ83419.1 P1 family peptidase [Rhizobium sp. K1/93]